MWLHNGNAIRMVMNVAWTRGWSGREAERRAYIHRTRNEKRRLFLMIVHFELSYRARYSVALYFFELYGVVCNDNRHVLWLTVELDALRIRSLETLYLPLWHDKHVCVSPWILKQRWLTYVFEEKCTRDLLLGSTLISEKSILVGIKWTINHSNIMLYLFLSFILGTIHWNRNHQLHFGFWVLWYVLFIDHRSWSNRIINLEKKALFRLSAETVK